MPRVVRRSTRPTMEFGQLRPGIPLPQFVSPQLSLLAETPPSGLQWVHEIKLDGYRIAARIENGRAQLPTRTGLDWTGKYTTIAEALATCTRKLPIWTASFVVSTTSGCRASPGYRRRPAANAKCNSSFLPSISCIWPAWTSQTSG